MNLLILEDEQLASDRLVGMLHDIDQELKIVGVLKSIDEGQKWFDSNELPDLVISDIRLLDGLSFDLFRNLELDVPVIFTTAYDQYAIKAFEVNSIDYLLKPILKDKLVAAIEKFKERKANNKFPADFESLYDLIQNQKKSFKSRFLIKSGVKIVAVSIEKVAYFYSQNKLTYLVTKDGKKFPLDQTLEVLEEQLDPDVFMRANRQFIVSFGSISEIHPYFKGRLKIELEPASDLEIVISAEKTPDFKGWLDQ
ncbi:LytR/AlgR family response regulator transcription factor [Marinoscillum sp.]|uniref:LytR/AlgR family response regulator transcription factor n=1 Tax=Marinoscillum sp. TaxID=2024838 RepID=UPI003BAC3732